MLYTIYYICHAGVKTDIKLVGSHLKIKCDVVSSLYIILYNSMLVDTMSSYQSMLTCSSVFSKSTKKVISGGATVSLGHPV